MFRPLISLASVSASIILASCDGTAGKHVDTGLNQTARPALTATIIDSLEDLDLLFAVSDYLADDEFYKMEGESLLELQASYIRANKEDFIDN